MQWKWKKANLESSFRGVRKVFFFGHKFGFQNLKTRSNEENRVRWWNKCIQEQLH